MNISNNREDGLFKSYSLKVKPNINNKTIKTNLIGI